MWQPGQRLMWHYGWVLLIISHHPTTFGGRRRCARENISKSLWHYGWVSHVISDYTAKFGDHRPFGRGNTNLQFFTWPHVNTWSESDVTSCMSFHHHNKLSCHDLWPYNQKRISFAFNWPCDLIWPHVQWALAQVLFHLYLKPFIYLCWPGTCTSNNWLKRALWLETQHCVSNLEL